MKDSAPVIAVGSFWIAPYSSTYMIPVFTMPSVTSCNQCTPVVGNASYCTNGASMTTPVVTVISAIRCGGVFFKCFVMIDETAYRKAAPTANATPCRYCPGIASTAGATFTTNTSPTNAISSQATVDAVTRSRNTSAPRATSMNGCVL